MLRLVRFVILAWTALCAVGLWFLPGSTNGAESGGARAEEILGVLITAFAFCLGGLLFVAVLGRRMWTGKTPWSAERTIFGWVAGGVAAGAGAIATYATGHRSAIVTGVVVLVLSFALLPARPPEGNASRTTTRPS